MKYAPAWKKQRDLFFAQRDLFFAMRKNLKLFLDINHLKLFLDINLGNVIISFATNDSILRTFIGEIAIAIRCNVAIGSSVSHLGESR